VPINKKHRTYTRRATVAPLQATRNMPRLGGWNKAADVHQAVGVTPASYGALHQKVVEQFAPPSALVNDEFDIFHLS
jgi:two-component system CheB/CheR fusion protein